MKVTRCWTEQRLQNNNYKYVHSTMIKEVMEGIMTMPYHIENKEIENMKKNPVEILGLRNTVIDMKQSLKGLNSIFSWYKKESANLKIN